MTIWYKAFLFGKNLSGRYRKFSLRKLPSPASLKHSWLHRYFGDGIFRSEFWSPTRRSLAIGLALGWFLGLLPLFGLQIELVLLFGFLLRCHLPTAVFGTFISNPLTLPGILLLQYGLGKKICLLLGIAPTSEFQFWTRWIQHGIPLGVGAFTSACGMGLVGFGLIWLAWKPKRRTWIKMRSGLRTATYGNSL